VLLFSLFMLPERAERRRAVYDRVLAAGASLHGALENLSLCEEGDVQRIEDIIAAERLAGRATEAVSRKVAPSRASRLPPYLAA
jgi:hypothetical protein